MFDDLEIVYVFKKGIGWVAQQKEVIDWSRVYVEAIWDPATGHYKHSAPFYLDSQGNRTPVDLGVPFVTIT